MRCDDRTPEDFEAERLARLAEVEAREQTRREAGNRVHTSKGEVFPDVATAEQLTGCPADAIRSAMSSGGWRCGRRWSRTPLPVMDKTAVISDRGERWPSVADAAAELLPDRTPEAGAMMVKRALNDIRGRRVADRQLFRGPHFRECGQTVEEVNGQPIYDRRTIRREYGCVRDERIPNADTRV